MSKKKKSVFGRFRFLALQNKSPLTFSAVPLFAVAEACNKVTVLFENNNYLCAKIVT
jgi:hypothetical protein